MHTSSVASASLSTWITRSRSAPYASVIGPCSICCRARSRSVLTSVRKSPMRAFLPPERHALVLTGFGRQSEHSLAEDVALDLVGAATDGERRPGEEQRLPLVPTRALHHA